MKKTYLNPTLTVVKVQPSRILSSSEVSKGGSYTGGQIQSRQGSFSGWTEEEE